MINNNPYNIPQKKPLSQSKILSQTNSSRNSSTYSNNRNSSEVMYSSGIFMKNSTIINPQYDQSFYEPVRQPLSPHTRFVKPPSAQFFGCSNIPQRPVDNYYVGANILKQNINEQSFFQLKQKISLIERRLQTQQRNQISLKQIQRNRSESKSDKELGRISSFQNLRHDDVFIGWINEIINKHLQNQNQQIWQKLQTVEQHLYFQKEQQFGEKSKILQQMLKKTQQAMVFHQQLVIKIKGIQKTIRQMGEDIHLINDKQENLSSSIQQRFSAIENDIRKVKSIQSTLLDQKVFNQCISKDVSQFISKLKSSQYQYDSRIQKTQNKMKQVQNKLLQLSNKIEREEKDYRNLRPSHGLKYKLQPFVLRYVQKLQISRYNTGVKFDQLLISQITYFIDNEGHLLDNDRNYLIKGPNNEKVRLNQSHLQVLKKHKILI